MRVPAKAAVTAPADQVVTDASRTRTCRSLAGVLGLLAVGPPLLIIRAVLHRLRVAPRSWFLVPVILLFFWLALDSARLDSPTMDEQNHLARGLAFLASGDPRFSLEHPPLVNSLSALPVLALTDINLPFGDPSWEQREGWYRFAELMMWELGNDVTEVIFLARLPITFLALGLGLVGFHFARILWGGIAAYLAFYFLLLDPNILAHARYATTDLGGATFLLLALLFLWRLWTAPGWNWRRLLLAALGLGLAFGSKLSTLAFVPILVVLAVLPLYGDAWKMRSVVRRLGQLLFAGLLSVFVVWAVFGLQWGQFRFAGESPFATLNHLSGPMPTFWAGIEAIAGLSTGGRGAAFLLGNFSTDGFPAYFLVAFLAKTPLATLLLLLGAVVLLLWRRATRGRALYLLLPAVLYFLLSSQAALNIGYRHLMPMLALLYVLIAGLGVLAVHAGAGRDRLAKPLRAGIALGVAGLLAATLAIHPYYLSFFNLAAGGPANGYRILIDSNVDWGQDLLRLKVWMAENDVERVKLSWFGSADPSYYDILYDPLPGLPRHFDLWWDVPFDPEAPEPGVYAISVSNLWEIPLQDEKYVFPYFRERAPDDRVGYSILIYRIGGES